MDLNRSVALIAFFAVFALGAYLSGGRLRSYYGLYTAIFLGVFGGPLALATLIAGAFGSWALTRLGPRMATYGPALSIFILPALGVPNLTYALYSFLVLRLSYLAWEIHRESLHVPRLHQYMNFAFYPPVSISGPIVSYGKYESARIRLTGERVAHSAERFTLGGLKVLVLAPIAQPLTLNALTEEGYAMTGSAVAGGAFFTTFYLYVTFSGVVDLALASASFDGRRLEENFRFPFLATDVVDFWRRWHATMTRWVFALLFQPLAGYLSRRLPTLAVNVAVAAAAFLAFFFIGIWHGIDPKFLLLGALNGSVVAGYFLMKNSLNRIRRRLKVAGALFSVAGWILTMAYAVVVSAVLLTDSDVLLSLLIH